MRQAIVIAAVLAGLSASAPAIAADMPFKAAPAIVAPTWTGLYVGADIGGVWTHTEGTWNPLPSAALFGADTITAAIDTSSISGGLHAGFNYQLGPSVVAGIEGDWTWTNASASFTRPWTSFGVLPGTFTTMGTKLDWLASVRGRLGYLVTPDVLAYVTGGGAWGGVDYAASNSNSLFYATAVAFSSTPSGYVVGGGLEWRMSGNWLLRGEYLFYRLSGASAVGTSVASPSFPSGYAWSDMDVNQGRIGVSYKF